MAASRAGIQTVFIPNENEDDLDEVPQEVRDKLAIIPVSDVTEVLEKTGILDGSAAGAETPDGSAEEAEIPDGSAEEAEIPDESTEA